MLDIGTVEQSCLTFVVVCMGTGILTSHFIFYANGILLGCLLLAFGITTTGVVSWMLTECTSYYNSRSYEEVAQAAFGGKMSKLTSVVMTVNQSCYLVAYTVLLKTLLPTAIESMINR